jgi:quercetin dioxygenase-like cupin family protein
MKRQVAVGLATLAFGVAPSFDAFAQQPAPPQPAPAAQPAPVKRTILQRADIPGTNLEVIYAVIEIAPGFKAGRHNHPGVVIGHVVEGQFWMHLDGQPERILAPGDSLVVGDRAVHNEGALDKPVKANVVYVLEKGKPLASPVQ